MTKTIAPPKVAKRQAPARENRPTPWVIENIVDGRQLRTQLTAAANVHGGDDRALKERVLELLHSALFRGRMIAQERLESGADGLNTAYLLSAVMDEVLSALYDFTTVHKFRARNPTEGERMAVMAVGGYGRNVLAPSSDVDLLFLRTYKLTAWAESVIEYMLYALWDMGLKVGHSFRTLDECVKLSKTDQTIRTAILDRRFLFGDADLAAQLDARYEAEVMQGRGAEFVADKLAERKARHERDGDSRYRVEPNVKDGKGGLRDLQTLFWLAKFIHGGRTIDEVLKNAAFTPADASAFRRQSRFLWTVRCHLHYLTGRSEERLSFDLQPELAARMGYVEKNGYSAVERFMKRYFLAAKDVGALTRILCAKLEADEQKKPSGLKRFMPAPTPKPLEEDGFIVDAGRLSVSGPEVFRDDPRNLLRVFEIADRRELDIHPTAMSAARRGVAALKAAYRKDPEARELFLSVATSNNRPGAALKLMNEAGVLGKFLPEFGRIVAQTQFNMYHHFTVDEHTLMAVSTINDIEQGRAQELHPLSTEIFPKLEHRRALYLAMLLHDTGKGQGDQQVEGAKTARTAALRLGLPNDEAELIAWLVGNHLEMSDTAQRRDISDPATVAQFAKLVGSVERLRLLLVLTVADIRAVGPGVWNAWKGQLLRDLYYATEAALRGGRTDEASVRRELSRRADAARAELQSQTGPLPAALEGVEDAYWISFDAQSQAWHAAALRSAEAETTAGARVDMVRASTEIIVYAPDRPSLFADLAAVLKNAGADLMAARLYSGAFGHVLDVFDVQDAQGRPFGGEDAVRRQKLMDELVAAARHGGVKRPKAQPASRRQAAFIVEPTVSIDRTASSEHTVVEVSGRDRPGLMYDIADVLRQFDLSIQSAHAESYGARVHDVFYVAPLDGGPLPKSVDAELTRALEAALTSGEPTAPRTPVRALQRARASDDR